MRLSSDPLPLNKSQISALRSALELEGFNLFSVLDGRAIDHVWAGGCVLLIGSAGPLLWQQMPARWHERENPLDEYSSDMARKLVDQHFPGLEQIELFPYNHAAHKVPSLQQLGRLAGWHHDSPLGGGINVEHGLWFAYRAAVFLPRATVAVSVSAEHRSPCLDCVDQPCLSACEPQALSDERPPDMQRCFNFRLQDHSPCRESCTARLACPVALEWQYSPEQIAYHYRHSLRSIRKWTNTRG